MDIKICGLTSVDDARAAWDAGADYLGFVLYDRSPRGISATTLHRISDALGETGRRVAVCVNMPLSLICELVRDCALHAVQFHGDERPNDCAPLSCPRWRAVRLDPGGPNPTPARWPAERYVVDGAAQGHYGGTGTRVDWSVAEALARRMPVMLAGGLTPENVTEAVRAVRPLGVDVSSGVEMEAGKKCHKKVRAFIQAVRAGEQSL